MPSFNDWKTSNVAKFPVGGGGQPTFPPATWDDFVDQCLAALYANLNANGKDISNVGQINFAPGGGFDGLAVTYSTLCDFDPQTPAQGLTASTPATVTLSPYPAGITSASVAALHRLYITDAIAGNEVVLLTAVSVGTTVTFTPALSHVSGNWSIGSATAGIQEAIMVAGANSKVFIPAGTYSVYAASNIPYSGMTIHGSGYGSTVLVPHTAGVAVFKADTVAGYLQLDIGHFGIAGNTHFAGKNTLIGVHIINANQFNVHDIAAFDVYRAVLVDRGSQGFVDKIQLWGNSTVWVGSTLDGGTNYCWNVRTSGIKHWGGASLALDATDSLVTLQRGVSCTLFDIQSLNLLGATNFITLYNDCQGCTIASCHSVGAIRGIRLLQNTVGSTTSQPAWISITDGTCPDACSEYDIYVDLNVHHTRISDCIITGKAGQIAGIVTIGNNYGTVCVGNSFTTRSAGVAFMVAGANGGLYWIFADNYVEATAPGSMVSVAGASDHWSMTGNTFAAVGGATVLTDTSSGLDKTIKGNIGLPDRMGAYANATLANGPNHNVVTNGKEWVVLSGPTAAFGVTGFAAGYDGQRLVVLDAASREMTIHDDDAGSLAANRIYTLTGADVVLRAGPSAATFVYSSLWTHWVLVSVN